MMNTAATCVLWDIKRFPVPHSFDARRVRPCIKRFLEEQGYAGPLTIVACGILTDVHDDTLRALSSAGIFLHYNPFRLQALIVDLVLQNPHPAALLALCNPNMLPSQIKAKYKTIMPFSYSNPEVDADIWESSILKATSADSGTLEEDTYGESAGWSCSICRLDGQGFESYTSHISSRQHARQRWDSLHVENHRRDETFRGEDMIPFDTVKRNHPEKLDSVPFHGFIPLEDDRIRDNMVVSNQQEAAEAATCVFWDIKRFPVPPGFDAHLIHPCIKRFVEKFGYYGPLTIYAVGILTDVHDDILRDLFSTGISLHYAPYGPTEIMLRWVTQNRPPANIVGLIDPNRIPPLLPGTGYNILSPFSHSYPGDDFVFWESSILAGAGAHEEETCSETGESPICYCLICNDYAEDFGSFTCHLSSRQHALKRFDCLVSKDPNKEAEKFEGEDMYPFDMVVRNQPKRLHDAPTKEPKEGKCKNQRT